MKKKVLIADDMSLVRRILSDVINSDPDLEVVAAATNGVEALGLINKTKPDIIVLDIEMPEMDGLEALRTIREIDSRTPVIMFSTLTEQGARITLDALEFGATDYVTKPSNMASFDATKEYLKIHLLTKLKGLTGLSTGSGAYLPAPEAPPSPSSTSSVRPSVTPPATPFAATSTTAAPIEAVVIGVSTGGPTALSELMPQLGLENSVPILIVQHMPATFTAIFAARLSAISAIPVAEAKDGDTIEKGRVYLAPGGYHMTVLSVGGKNIIKLNQEAEENFCRPAVDPLFRTASAVWQNRLLGVVMTGMGQDGLLGSEDIRRNGGQVIVQDEASSVVWGMPGAVARANLAQAVLPLSELGAEIQRRLWVSRAK